ncbi:jg17291 [Pararge aegeria aegeria]|uniref:Jg17291 protein n=1 Tax=Pararge aegeria aegeria TaxID=348720 RepID=A0A8S4R2R0_9NEOP|nr:jg17291 [Pararge aegeria aegeria]
MTSDESLGAAGGKRPRIVYCGTPYKRPVSSSGSQLVDMIMMTLHSSKRRATGPKVSNKLAASPRSIAMSTMTSFVLGSPQNENHNSFLSKQHQISQMNLRAPTPATSCLRCKRD